jgi:RimJ/RimL family protein N-acetyltransferase
LKLETERLILRPMQASDLDDLCLVFGDAKVMAAFGEQPLDRAQTTRWMERNLVHQREHGFGLFSVVLRENGRVIGDCGLEAMEVDGEAGFELGYDLASAYWNRGLATEAALAVREYAFGELHLPELVSLVRIGNNASRRVAEKAGMTLRRELLRDGVRYWLFGQRAVSSGPDSA